MKLNAANVAAKLETPVRALLLATVYAKAERERVDAIKRELLAEREYLVAPEFANREGERITEPKDYWLMNDADAAEFHAKMQAIHLANGYADAAKGFCPACVAEHLQTQAEWALIEASQVFFPDVTNDGLLMGRTTAAGKRVGGLETRAEYLDLLCKLVVNRPGFKLELPKQ